MQIENNLVSNYITALEQTSKASGSNNTAGTDFKAVLNGLMDYASTLEQNDNAANTDLINGNVDNIHSVLIPAEKADIIIGLAVQVRNKVIDAYSQIMNMQI